MGSRYVIVGASGSGKTTLARRLASRLGAPHVELDALFWEPGWIKADPARFRDRVSEVLSGDFWVADGNYREVRDIVWGRADTVVWLDLPLRVVLGRIVPRSIRRAALRERLWGSNTETFSSLLGRDSIVLFAVGAHKRQRASYPALLRSLEGVEVVHLRSAGQAEEWLDSVESGTLNHGHPG